MAIRNAKRALLGLAALIALTACNQKPASVTAVEKYLGDEKSVVNSPVAEGAKEAAGNAAQEALGPAGEVVGVGQAALGAVSTGALVAIRDQMNRAEVQATTHNEQVYQDRADYFTAKYDCFSNPKDKAACAKWQAWQARGLPPLPTEPATDAGHGGHGGGD